jgi:Fe-S cluster assembly iron-binding protein IscA
MDIDFRITPAAEEAIRAIFREPHNQGKVLRFVIKGIG